MRVCKDAGTSRRPPGLFLNRMPVKWQIGVMKERSQYSSKASPIGGNPTGFGFCQYKPFKENIMAQIFVDENQLTSAVCDLTDVIESLSQRIKNQPKDSDGTEITIGDCLHDIQVFLDSLESQVK